MTSTVSSYTGFTSGFVDGLAESRRRLDEFVDSNKKRADSLVAECKKVQGEEQTDIDALLRQLHSLQYERGVAKSAKGGDGDGGVAEQRKKLEYKQASLEEEVSRLRTKNRVEREQLDEVLAEEAAMRRKADEVRAKKEEVEMARGITVEDLTKGLQNYQFTGLSFWQGEKGALNFKFTKLDREDQARTFTFTLNTDEQTNYELSECNPPLDESKTGPLVDGLNADEKNGFNSFAVGMRKLFKETLQ